MSSRSTQSKVAAVEDWPPANCLKKIFSKHPRTKVGVVCAGVVFLATVVAFSVITVNNMGSDQDTSVVGGAGIF